MMTTRTMAAISENANAELISRRRPIVLGLATLLMAAVIQSASAEKPKTGAWTLANGIRVVAVCFAQSTNVAIFSYVPMGLVADGPNQAQWSHLVEHMTIRSTIPGELTTANAETLPDHMRLDFYGNSGNWQEGLSHHQRWLQGAPFTEASLVAEKPKVKGEGEFTARNFATHKFAFAAWAQGFRHGQTNAAIQGDVDRVSLSEIQRYRDSRLAVLSNTLVCVVGGLEPAKVQAIVSREFGAIKSTAKAAARVKLHPGNREMTWDLDARHIVLTWPAPTHEDRDFPALLVAAQWLNMQFFSDATLKNAMIMGGADLAAPEGNFFHVSGCLRPGTSFEEVQGKVEQYAGKLSATNRDLPMLSGLCHQLAESLTTIQDPASMKGQLPPDYTPAMLEMNLGLQWGMNEFRYGKAKANLARKVSALKAEEVRQAAAKYLAPSNCSVIRLKFGTN